MNLPTLFPTSQDTFVGLRFNNNKLELHFPIELEDVIKKDELKFAYKFLRTLHLNRKYFYQSNDSNIDSFKSMSWIINDFLNNGLNKKKIVEFKQNSIGKINWKKSYKSSSFLYSKKSLIINDFITEKHNELEDEIYKIHQYCLNYSTSCIGWLFKYHYKDKPKINLTNSKNILIKILQKTFQDNLRIKYSHLLTIIKKVSSLKDSQSFIILGANDYNLVFQNMLHRMLNTENLKLKNYNPIGIYKFIDGNVDRKSQILPDIIYENLQSNLSIIFDAKFYRKDHSLPQTSDIQKQIVYARYIKNQYKDILGQEISVLSSFILPYNGKSFFSFFGEAFIEGVLDFKGDKIACFYVNLKDLIDAYLDQKIKVKLEISKLEKQLVKMNSV